MALNIILRIIPSDLFNKTNIMNRSLNENLCVTKIKYIMYNVQDMLLKITLFGRLYVRVDILLTCGKHLHKRTISPRGRGAWAHKTSLTRNVLLRCLYQATRVSGQVFVF